jgi:hypothetical protein
MGRDSSVGIATRYGMDGPGFESRWGRDFPHPPRLVLVSIQWVSGLSWGVMRPGCGVDHPLPTNIEVKERVEVYSYSHSGPSWPVLGRTLSLQSLGLKCTVSDVALKKCYYFYDLHFRTYNFARQIVMTDKSLCNFSVFVSAALKHLRDRKVLID